MDNRERSILKTLLYADIFNFPLTKSEIWRFLISDKKIEEELLFKNINSVNKFIKSEKGFYFILGKKELILLRKKRKRISKLKIKKIKNLIKKISFVPLIKFIGISGALSMENSDEDDDIDLFVITEKKLVWTTRFILVFILILLGVYRNKKSKDYKDKICLNMIIDEENMIFNKKNQNLYTAHEITQMIPVFEKDNIYKKFIEKNNWYEKFLPNATQTKRVYLKKTTNFFDFIFIYFLKIIHLENLLRFIQKKYMQKSITKETVEKGFLALHPFDYKSYVLDLYRKKLNIYKL